MTNAGTELDDIILCDKSTVSPKQIGKKQLYLRFYRPRLSSFMVSLRLVSNGQNKNHPNHQ